VRRGGVRDGEPDRGRVLRLPRPADSLRVSASVPNATAIRRPAFGERAGVPALEFLRHPVSAVDIAIVALGILVAIAARLRAPIDRIAQPARRLLAPDSRYLLGTDEFGRDVLSRIIYGSRVSLQVGIISVGIALLLGGTVGLASGYFLKVLDI